MARTLAEIDLAPAPQPKEIRIIKDKTGMTIAFDDGETYNLSAELLRVESPSAEVQGHGAGQKQLVPGKSQVRIISVTPNGNYAVRLGFDDGHSTGIFSWRYLRFLGENATTLMDDYLDNLADAGMTRS
ncbi:MAG: gamma-butyrobetaine hydroxylase-like domain-containing protein [Alphaproteobacteria bacterium]|jgi:DUF971 family protein